MKTRIHQKSFLKCLAGLAVACGPMMSAYAQAEENKETILFDTSSGFKWSSYVYTGEGATTTGRYWAQGFKTGPLGIVSSVSLPLAVREGTFRGVLNHIPSGVLKVVILDDKEGVPGKEVGSLGEIDISSLKIFSNNDIEHFTVTFENPVFGLEPNSVYYVALDYVDSGAFVLRQPPGRLIDPEVERATVYWYWSKDPGENTDIVSATYPTIEDPATPDGIWTVPPVDTLNWQTLDGLEGSVGIMTVTELIDDNPIPEITSVQMGIDSISLTWTSLPFKLYIVEYTADLQAGSWIELEDGIESGGDETVFVDEDAERLAAKKGFYRVRLEN